MKIKTTIETTKEVELSAPDLVKYAKDLGIVPKEWKFYSVEIIGNGISNGATLKLKHTKN